MKVSLPLAKKLLSDTGPKKGLSGAIENTVDFIGNIVVNALLLDEKKPAYFTLNKENSSESQEVIEESFVGVPLNKFADKQIVKVFQEIYGEEQFNAMQKKDLYVIRF